MLEYRPKPTLTERHGVKVIERAFSEGDYFGSLEAAAFFLQVDPDSEALEDYFLRSAEKLDYGECVKKLLNQVSWGHEWFELPGAFYTVRQHINRRAH